MDIVIRIVVYFPGGYYSVKLNKSLRLLVLNTNLYYTSNKLTASLDDPAEQWAWMEEQLQDVMRNGQKVTPFKYLTQCI